jgi:hypothetical protein
VVRMSKFYLDTELIDDGITIQLISIGIVNETDDDYYYAVNRDAPWQRIARSRWLIDNVVPSLPRIGGDRKFYVSRKNPLAIDLDHPSVRSRALIAHEVRDFLLSGAGEPELWAWYGAYDHVALCQLWVE